MPFKATAFRLPFLYICITLLLVSCESPKQKNELVVLGSIHKQHITSKKYSTEKLKSIIRNIKPDIVLAEIPPDRFESTMLEFKEKHKVTDKFLGRFAEYSKAVFPLESELGYEIVPVSAWTRGVAMDRARGMKQLRQDSTNRPYMQALRRANQQKDSVMKANNGKHDLHYLHSALHDSAVNIWSKKYNEVNDQLGKGGWDNVNTAHYALIDQALNDYAMQGKRVLLIFGAGHLGFFKERLQQRDDITLLDVNTFFE